MFSSHFPDCSGIYRLSTFFVCKTTPNILMAPTHQEKTNQKLNNDITVIHAKMDHIQEQLSSRTKELHSTLQQFLSKGPSSSGTNPHVEGANSSNPMKFHSNCDPHLPKVEVNKFDGSYPIARVTQMEHCFFLHGITDDLNKLCYDVLYLDME
jgi:uncharacterized coiled-coil protein SlyX